jgi:hypothetical protein
MCKKCTKAHRKSKASRDHKIFSMEDVFKQLKTKLSDKLKLIKDNKSSLAKTVEDIDKEIANIKYTHQDLCMQADKYADHMIGEINKQREQVKHEIVHNENDYLNQLMECRNEAVKYINENDSKCSVIGEVLNTDNMSVLKDSVDSITVDVHNQELPVNNSKKCELQLNRNFNPRVFISLKKVTGDNKQEFVFEKKLVIGAKSKDSASDFTGTSKNNVVADKLKIKDKVDLKLIINAKFKVVKECDAVENCSRICKVNGDIWQTQFNHNSIAVYSKDLKKLNTIKHEQLSGPLGLTVTEMSKVIVACHNGLHELQTDGKYSGQISAGYYQDLTYYSGKVYALKDKPKCVEVYTLTDGKFVLTQSIDIHHVKTHILYKQ